MEKNNSSLAIRKINFSGNLTKGQILVKLKYSGICGKQIDEIKGTGGKDLYLPHLLGHEGSGIVERIGSGVNKIYPGDKVFLSWIKGKGFEAGGTKIYNQKKIINFTKEVLKNAIELGIGEEIEEFVGAQVDNRFPPL